MDFSLVKTVPFKMVSIAVGPGSALGVLFFGLMSMTDTDLRTLASNFIIHLIPCAAPMALILKLSLYAIHLTVSLLVLPRLVQVFILGSMFEELIPPGL